MKLTMSDYLKPIPGAEALSLESTDGEETITKSSLFSHISVDFHDWGCDVKSTPTRKQNVAVYEIIKNGNSKAIFSSLGDDLDTLCLTQPQVIHFRQNHFERLTQSATLFLFKIDRGFLVASVHVFAGGGIVPIHLKHFSDDYVWHAGADQVVLPQLKRKS